MARRVVLTPRNGNESPMTLRDRYTVASGKVR
jgi:hypothetical protein